MSALDELVESLLYEGYALYPYSSGATKNSTPTPFGIVYPPAYAERMPAAFDHLRMECGLLAPEGAELRATVRFLQATGEAHSAEERRIELPAPGEPVEFAFDGLEGRARLRADDGGDGVTRVRVCVHNTTPLADADIDRAEALRSSLLSTHVIATAPGSRFLSPIESDRFESVNTFPVLATPEDDTVVGATIILPDHPQLAPESRGNLFDGTEIEEALLLHVHTLSDHERDAIADPAVRAMVERASATTPDDLFALHGMMRPSDPGLLAPAADRSPEQTEPPRPPANLPNFPGEQEVVLGGATFRRGDSVRLRPSRGDGDPIDHMVDGRTATIEKILYDVDDRVYFAVTVDGDPGQELLRDTGRFLYFFEGEVEPA
jgi:hypothetical protein